MLARAIPASGYKAYLLVDEAGQPKPLTFNTTKNRVEYRDQRKGDLYGHLGLSQQRER